MKNFIRKTIKLILLFICFLLMLGYYLDYQFENDYSNKFIWLSNIENQYFDYAFIGSSRTLNMIDINLADSLMNQYGINLGIGGADFRIQYLQLYTFIEINNNTLKEIFIQVDPFSLYEDSVYNKPRYDHYFYKYSDNELVKNSLHQSKMQLIYKMLPVIKYIEFNNVYNLTHFIRSFNERSEWDITKGSSLIYNHSSFNTDSGQSHTPVKYKYYAFDPEEEKYLHKIIELCLVNNIKVTLYGAPVFDYQNNYKSRYPNFDRDILKLTNKLNVKYINFLSYDYDKSLFKDYIHLNYKGVAFFTENLLDQITDASISDY